MGKYLIPTAVFLYILGFILKFSFFATDDAFIHFRIARHIVEYGQPYYNIGEPVLGSSPHLWINLIAALFALFGQHIGLIVGLEVLASMACFLLLKKILLDVDGDRYAALGAFVIVAVCILPAAAGLMETPLAVALMLASVLFFRSRSFVAAAFIAGICPWLRLEYILIPIFLAVVSVRLDVSRRRRFEIFAAISAPMAIYVGYCLFYFGTVVPLPVLTKTKVYSINVLQFFGELPTASSFSYPMFLPYWVKSAVSALAIGALFFFLARHVRRDSRPLYQVSLFSLALVVLTVYFFRLVYVFPWYAPLFSVPLAAAYLLIFRSGAHRFKFMPLVLLGFFNIVFIGFWNNVAYVANDTKYFDEYGPGWRVQQYLKIGEDLYRHHPRAVLMTSEIGALGWTFRGRIVDGGALVSPETAKYHPLPAPQDRPWETAGAIPHRAVADIGPDIVVSMPIFSQAVRREIESGNLPYRLIATVPVIPPDESAKSGIYRFWSSDRIDTFVRLAP